MAFLLVTMMSSDLLAAKGKCQTKYPIMLVHGFMFRDNTFGIDYFGTIPATLKKEKAIVIRGGQQGWDSELGGANEIWKNVNRYFIANPSVKKMNFICHSQGAIQFRLMYALYKDVPINGKPFRDRVASFTVITSPLKGTNIVSFLEDTILGLGGRINIPQDKMLQYMGGLLSVISKIVGDPDPSRSLGPMDMRPSRMALLNKQIKTLLGYNDLAPGVGLKGIYCQSWIARTKMSATADPTINIGKIIQDGYGDSPNDGVVPEWSAPYAKVRGVISGPWWNLAGIGHQAMVDRGLMGFFHGGTPGFDVPKFYVNLVSELKTKGF